MLVSRGLEIHDGTQLLEVDDCMMVMLSRLMNHILATCCVSILMATRFQLNVRHNRMICERYSSQEANLHAQP